MLVIEMNEKLDIIYFVYDGIITQSVFDSQVLSPLKELQRNNDIKIHLIGFESMRAFFAQYRRLEKKRREIIQKLKINATFYPRIPGEIGIYFNLLITLFFTPYSILRKKTIIFHARGSKAAFIGCKLKKIFPVLKVIYDARGVEPEEYLYSLQLRNPNKKDLLVQKEKRKIQRLNYIEKYVIEYVDRVLCVSNEFRKHYLRKYNIEDKKINFVPCGVDINTFFYDCNIRNRIRKEMRLNDKLVFIYSGSMYPLQMPEKTIRFLKEFYKLDKEVFLLVLTFEIEKVQRFLDIELNLCNNYKVLKVNHKDVPIYLNAGDIGILLREKNIVNRVACPTKFAEYAACGLYIVMTDEIGDISEIVKNEKMGEVIKALKIDEMKTAAKKILAKRTEIQKNENKEKISHLAKNIYSWENLVPMFWRTYEDLLRKDGI